MRRKRSSVSALIPACCNCKIWTEQWTAECGGRRKITCSLEKSRLLTGSSAAANWPAGKRRMEDRPSGCGCAVHRVYRAPKLHLKADSTRSRTAQPRPAGGESPPLNPPVETPNQRTVQLHGAFPSASPAPGVAAQAFAPPKPADKNRTPIAPHSSHAGFGMPRKFGVPAYSQTLRYCPLKENPSRDG